MTSREPGPSTTDAPFLTTRAGDMLILPTIVVAVALSALITVVGAEAPLVGRIFGLWMIWTPIGVTVVTRGLRDRVVAARGNPFRRARLVVGKWCGWTGVGVAGVIVLVLSLTTPNEWMSEGLYISVAAGACALLAIRGPARRIGTGILIACAAPGWPYLLLVGAALVIPLLITLLTAAITARIERRRRYASSASSPT